MQAEASDPSILCAHLAKRTLAEDFEQFELRRIGFLTTLFHMMGDWNLLICPFILHKQLTNVTPLDVPLRAARGSAFAALTQCEKGSPSSMGSSMT